jgi:hypothetical protein
MATGQDWIGGCMGTQNRNPNLKPESVPNTNSDKNPSPKRGYPKSAWIPKAILYSNIVRAISTFYRHKHDIYNIHMYKQEAINNK